MSNLTPKYSLKRKYQDIPIEMEDGSVVNFQIRRASGEAIEEYLDENADRISTAIGDDGKVKIQNVKSYKGMFVSLLKRCLYKNDVLVSPQEIASFPHEVQKGLFNDAQMINGLSEEGSTEAKK